MAWLCKDWLFGWTVESTKGGELCRFSLIASFQISRQLEMHSCRAERVEG
jgi:hypothetical protein